MSELERLKDRLGYDPDGVGESRLEALVDHFGSAEAVPLTDMDALREAEGIGPTTAGRIWEVAEPQSESDPETTEAEAITVPTDDVLEEIADDNPFKAVVESLREEGLSWGEIYDHAADAYNPIDKAAFEESFVMLPDYRIRVVVPDPDATSGERYETLTRPEPTKDDAREWALSKPEVRRVESIERVGEVKVG